MSTPVSSKQEFNKEYLDKVDRLLNNYSQVLTPERLMQKLATEKVSDANGLAGPLNNNNSSSDKDSLFAVEGELHRFAAGRNPSILKNQDNRACDMSYSPAPLLCGSEERTGPRFYLNLPSLHFNKDEESQMEHFEEIHRHTVHLPWATGPCFLHKLELTQPNQNLKGLYSVEYLEDHHCRYVDRPNLLDKIPTVYTRPLRPNEMESHKGFTHTVDTVNSHRMLTCLQIRWMREEITQELSIAKEHAMISNLVLHAIIREAERILLTHFSGPHRAVLFRLSSTKIENENKKWIHHLITRYGFSQPDPDHPEYLMGPEF